MTPPYCRTLCGSVVAGLPFRDDDAEEESDVQGHQENGDDSHKGRSDEETVRDTHHRRNSLTSGQCARMPRRITAGRQASSASAWCRGNQWFGGPAGSPGNPAAPPGGAIETKEPKNQRNGDILPQAKIQIG
jgi:hypothetical protein